ncbi:FAD/NAD(P)-binding protein [Paracoccus sp. MBLB3053]|uniref:FAD/NAD(P)-binding protein n=1 Tax=Paracoccus aurantius TaxID=3073814 RepID=A0ABU2HV28_9RHOB|nr:FAD-dependent oxidoreductase [Paracoccus sp. MBLB3053]MDS9468910.1 FAD/NAD(P)-binding protein [Paracoccus sp. MBLB3053]
MSLNYPFRLRVVIIGGGFSGATLAWQLAEEQVPVRISVVEPRPELGRGLAYSSGEPCHRINVPAHRMTMQPERPEDFMHWLVRGRASGRLETDPEEITLQGEHFPRREIFGRYVAERLAPHLQSGRIRHHRARVADLAKAIDGSFELMLSDDSRIRGDILVLATGHPPTALPRPLAELRDRPQLIGEADDPARIASLGKDARVLILGAGLGSADVVARLDRQGHEGPITCLSRHGLRSRGHVPAGGESRADFTDPPIRRASKLLRRVRDAVVDDEAQGQDWHATFHRLRAQGAQIWAGLDQCNRARLLRHLRTLWDVHRYRLAPQVEAVLERRIVEGKLSYVAGRLVEVEGQGATVRVSWRPRGGNAAEQADFDAVINTTGPAQGRTIESNPALWALARLGLIAPDPLGLGLATSQTCQAVDAAGMANPRILIAGPLARGHLGELVGAPECAAQVGAIAREIARQALLVPILRPVIVSTGGATANPT